jgi:hypothetical protein
VPAALLQPALPGPVSKIIHPSPPAQAETARPLDCLAAYRED